MKKQGKRLIRKALVCAAGAALAACGGGGGDETAATSGDSGALPAAYTLPSAASAVTPQGTEGAGLLTGLHAAYLAFTAPADSDYAKDQGFTFTNVEGQEGFDQVNMVLCYFDQIAVDKVLNKVKARVTYTAKVNATKCENQQAAGKVANAQQKSKAKNTRFVTVYVDATPASSNNGTEVAKFWVDVSQGMDYWRVYGEVQATAGKSATNPFGEFTLNWRNETSADGTTWDQAGPGGVLKAELVNGQPQLSYYEETSVSGQFYTKLATVVRYDAGSSTQGVAHVTEFDAQSKTSANPWKDNDVKMAFDARYVLADVKDKTTGATKSYCRDRTQYKNYVLSYNLYHAAAGTYNGKPVTAGQRLSLTVGFPFTTTVNGKTVNGWADSWGAWLENGGTLADGDTVDRITDFSTGATTELTARVSNGVLIKRTAASVSVTALVGSEFQWYYSGFPAIAGLTQDTLYKVHFDPNNYRLMATQKVGWDQMGQLQLTNLASPVDVTPGNINTEAFYELWPMGPVSTSYQLQLPANQAPTSSTTLTTFADKPVRPASQTALPNGVATTLYCWWNCPVGGTGTTQGSQVSYHTGTPPFPYTVSVSNGKVVLTDQSNNQPVDPYAGTQGQPGNFVWMEMSTSNTSPTSNPSYTFMAGDPWSQQVNFFDANNQIVAFDEPLSFTYRHATANDRNGDATYDGKTFHLVYDGYSLQGFPFKIDPNGGWPVPLVDLADHTELTDADGHAFVVKAMGMMQAPTKVANSACTNAGLSTATVALTLPTSTALGTVGFSWVDKPAVSGGPRVVEGVLQY